MATLAPFCIGLAATVRNVVKYVGEGGTSRDVAQHLKQNLLP